MLYQLSYEATHWERGQFIEFMSPVRSEMTWSIHVYEIIHIWTADVDESEEWSSQLIFQFKQLERRNAAWTVCAINEAWARENNSSLANRNYSFGHRRRQLVERCTSEWSQSTWTTIPACHLIEQCRLQTIVCRTQAHVKVQPVNRVKQPIKSLCELSESNNKTQMTWHPKPSCKPRPPRTRTLGDTAGQHCLAFNLA